MAKFKNISPQGALDLPLLGRIIAAGEEFEVGPEDAKHLTRQPGVWQRLDGYNIRNVAELREILTERELETRGNKAELIDRLVESDEANDQQGASA